MGVFKAALNSAGVEFKVCRFSLVSVSLNLSLCVSRSIVTQLRERRCAHAARKGGEDEGELQITNANIHGHLCA